DQACGSAVCLVVMPSLATDPIDGKASPRKPSVRMRSRSSSSSLEVAWRSTASARSVRVMPPPSSVMPIRRLPPPSVKMSIRLAPASIAFSTSSLTTLAGRSTTSPAAMRLTICSGNWRTGMGSDDSWERGPDLKGFCRIKGGQGARPGRALPAFSVVVAAGTAPRLDVAAALFALQPSLLRPEGRLGRAARGRPDRGFAQQFDQPVDCVGAVALLGAEALRKDHDHAVLGHALAGEPIEPRAQIVRQHDASGVEAQLRGGGELVDVLPARAGGAHEADLDV